MKNVNNTIDLLDLSKDENVNDDDKTEIEAWDGGKRNTVIIELINYDNFVNEEYDIHNNFYFCFNFNSNNDTSNNEKIRLKCKKIQVLGRNDIINNNIVSFQNNIEGKYNNDKIN